MKASTKGGTVTTSDDVAEGEGFQASTSTIDVEAKKFHDDIGISPLDVEIAQELAASLTVEDAITILQDFVRDYKEDMCIPASTLEGVRKLLDTVQSKDVDPNTQHEARTVAAVLHGNSPYREVRAIISPTDDPEEPANTIRMWVIGLIWAGGLSAINTFFAPRQPAITVAVYLAQLFGLVMGKLAAKLLPTKVFFQGSRFAFTLNPGPWTLKEQTLVTVMANVSYFSPLITQLFFMQRLPMYMGSAWASSFGYSVLMWLSAQLLGLGLAGMSRRFLIYPGWAIWYFVLSQSAMNKAFVTNVNLSANGWKISQLKFFAIVFVGAWWYVQTST
ncbi:hypothetical protein ACHAPJ_012624 [Fusarium lateritium]